MQGFFFLMKILYNTVLQFIAAFRNYGYIHDQ